MPEDIRRKEPVLLGQLLEQTWLHKETLLVLEDEEIYKEIGILKNFMIPGWEHLWNAKVTRVLPYKRFLREYNPPIPRANMAVVIQSDELLKREFAKSEVITFELKKNGYIKLRR